MIGWTIALLVARLGIPSFVVTLAFFLGLQGVMLLIIGEGGTIPIRNDAILDVMNKNMPVAARLAVRALVVAGFAAATFLAIRAAAGPSLPTQALSVWAAKVAGLAVVVLVAVFLLNQERQRANAPIVIQGVPWVVPLVTVLFVGADVPAHPHRASGATSTRSAATPRPRGAPASTSPDIKTYCFILGSTLAVVAGILLASRDNSVSPTTGGAQTLLYAVGAAVIGGTTLFGGRGRVSTRSPAAWSWRSSPTACRS